MDDIDNVAALPETVRYHLAEAAIVATPGDPRRSVPSLKEGDRAILDIGCGVGQTLVAPELRSATTRCGVDVDQDSISFGRKRYPELDLRVAPAERLPFSDCCFDLAFSRVAFPYTNLPIALKEAHRVLKPGARIWLTLHPPALLRARTAAALKSLQPKPIIDAAYIWLNSLIFIGTGRCVARPWSGQFETVQTVAAMSRAMRAVGFQVSRASQASEALCIEGYRSQ